MIEKLSIFQAIDHFQKTVSHPAIKNLFSEYSSENTALSAHKNLILQQFTDFITCYPDCFLRSCLPGHITASAFIFSVDFKEVLLTFHAKLLRWMQLGGHADGDPSPHRVALKEAKEESGLQSVDFFLWNRPFFPAETPIPFDFDIHLIPQNPKEESHLHYDVRYLFLADRTENLTISHESIDLKWIPLEQVLNYIQ